MKHVAPREISGPKSARPHGGIPSPGAEQRRGQWVISGQGFALLKKAMHGTYISYCRRAIFGTSARPLLSLRAAIYSPVPFIDCIGSSYIKLRFDRSADLRSLRWYSSTERLAGVGYMRIVHRVTRGKVFRFCT
jgi:hypothetical protein